MSSSRGVEPRVHKIKGKHRESGLSVEDVKGLVQFIFELCWYVLTLSNNLTHTLSNNSELTYILDDPLPISMHLPLHFLSNYCPLVRPNVASGSCIFSRHLVVC